ncbi:MAG: peptide chain release factor family protein [Promethearchaeota archaeon]|jgi:protein subunit release factor A
MKELLFSIKKEDLNITYFSGKGGGGQHRNRHMNCVRLNHKDSGTMVTGQSNRERKANIKEALSNLTNSPKFKVWHSRRVFEALRQKTIEQEVEELMSGEYLLIESI